MPDGLPVPNGLPIVRAADEAAVDTGTAAVAAVAAVARGPPALSNGFVEFVGRRCRVPSI